MRGVQKHAPSLIRHFSLAVEMPPSPKGRQAAADETKSLPPGEGGPLAVDEGQSIGGGCIEKVLFPSSTATASAGSIGSDPQPGDFYRSAPAPPDIPSARKGRDENKRETRGINGSPMQGASLERGTRPKGGLS